MKSDSADATTTLTGNKALLFFAIGPVQPFIEKARTVRDLTTGSYLLSWLTSKAAQRVLDSGRCELITPDEALVLNAKSPTMPNRFVAEVDAEAADRVADNCRRACFDAWHSLCEAVHQKIANQIPEGEKQDWDILWKSQTGTDEESSPLDIHTHVVSIDDSEAKSIRRLLGTDKSASDGIWDLHFDLTWSLDAVRKQTRHVHRYSALTGLAEAGLNLNFVPGKCTMFGGYEQLGPADMEASRKFWTELSGDSGIQVRAARLRPRERLCAIGMVKRFGWFAFLERELRLEREARGETEKEQKLRFPDTATVAAARWFAVAKSAGDPVDPNTEYDDTPWSGQWLHWPTPTFDKDERPCPQLLFELILKSRSNPAIPRVPTYYAILMLDGDFMGRLSRSLTGPDEQRKFSKLIGKFAQSVQTIVEVESDGVLVYAGGDDVLALLPLETAIDCAVKLWTEFCSIWKHDELCKKPGIVAPTCSAGLAVVHHKHDLRFALNAARTAEKNAKSCRSTKDALSLTVCRRSGQHTTAAAPWQFVQDSVNKWVGQFRTSDETGSDRWTYHLAKELIVLEGLESIDAIASEIGRLIKRSKVDMKSADVVAAFRSYYDFLNAPDAHPGDAGFRARSERSQQQDILARSVRGFVTLAQSASFLARGRDEQ